ncbi:MAG TPA: acyl-phosphate glycerol 3-phosphate acyltransferase [Sporomusaceae bacterium]|jgi:glycerol-3-phosphate acyltransferase PlsY|uniref:glycerol-3-phosphate 1-O-acyltransferase PlsY n=1 Tax=Anaerospora sp. TaxID=1960278 RepID=UPI000EB89061|nr:glycerol-3-phosphate 1-O-acyltransferase PlsY [Anaerospora sp.]MDF2928435.1 plsY [Anaerospora sp.]HAK72903.1 acyl-phosphate glycerol 3-phosphate acyltransferase [Sporomusaceae bacterium]
MSLGLTILIAYLIGSIPNGLIVGKFMCGVDIRQFGSKNIGATNAYRVLGPWPAFWVFITDALKGVAGVMMGQWLDGNTIALLAGGIAAMAGHNWSVFLKFKGGRGVATGLGVIAVLVPKVTAIVFIVWALIVYTTRYVSLGSIVAAVLVPLSMWFFNESIEILLFGIVAALFVILRHKPNIERLLKGEELKIKAGGSSADSTKEK